MPNIRKPTNVLALTGSFKKNPATKREREAEPKSNGDLGEPPNGLSIDELLCWHEVVDITYPGVLCRGHRLVVEMLARQLAFIRSMPPGLDPKYFARVESLLGKLGLTPADQSRVSAKGIIDAKDQYGEFR